MKIWAFESLLTEKGWMTPAYVTVDDGGLIVSIDREPRPDMPVYEQVPGFAVPGFQNAHSHAFQYAMAGLAEHLRGEDDDFWSWREAMYTLALEMRPEEVEATAAMLYAEMLRHGYTSVAEFHYLHHDVNGQFYDDPAEISGRLIAAAERVGIRLTLVPIFYSRGGFGQEPGERQRRFICRDVEDYVRLWQAAEEHVAQANLASLGVGIHSLRAATQEQIAEIFENRADGVPLHIHIAEQQKEVEDCETHLGARPVAWLLDHADLDADCHLVHATHIEQPERLGIIRSGASVVICPSTEGNLGDGFFPIREYIQEGGYWSIGTDSHIGLSPMEELRWLDYGARLRREKRNVLCGAHGKDSGQVLFDGALTGGRRAMGNPDPTYFAAGRPFDAVILKKKIPLLEQCAPARRLATFIHAGDASWIHTVIVDGKIVCRNGNHPFGHQLSRDFSLALNRLGNRQ